ncbi:putative quinol monooxygenase [Variovorax sp. J22G21]|uniref:putative quinol monooxygenase n=1 Tax=Variovorax fucosicus TaxID=3053517 RepID=UPI002577B722|nr:MULTISPECIES: putative quinol monooxygenase [unclassified Variovorax]MDM0040977.1 putative quinol monooxygenase [Variovorax sp. J22R193]MDM0057365.1 putative quinol monooxygenase [Variovorax sp. J22G47]MDM0060034.1 putative quinol monooxygenase [Variovorax sp. J22G21]
MILVTGTIVATADAFDEILALSVEHVHRSRSEPGCISHAVHRDAEHPLRLVFIEQWADAAALKAHFGVPASRGFAKTAGALAAEPPTIQIYNAEAVSPAAL